ncbi:lytic transglycosylase domain-containing protein [Streptomyces virginiae]|uniref:lytic transglycosylase domain-containing protein n=1 Tax=Streptomyces virginiae TaxID=1961 RepID=UPI0036B2A77D
MVLALPVVALILIAGLIAGVGADSAAAASTLRGVPPEFEPWILKVVAECEEHPELTPTLMAAQLRQESGFSTSRKTVSYASARGPAQLVDGMWSKYRNDADGNGRADPFDVGDAVIAQGRCMCSLIGDAKNSGLGDDVPHLALAGYNAGWGAVLRFRGVPPKSWADGQTYWYVVNIMKMMADFEGAPLLNVGGSGAGALVLRRAAARIGAPVRVRGAADPAAPAAGSATTATASSAAAAPPPPPSGSATAASPSTPTGPTPSSPAPLPRSTRPPPTGPLPAANSDRTTCCSGPAATRRRRPRPPRPRAGRNVEVLPLDSAMPAADYRGATRL